jgi:hypothetical protein
VSGGFRGGLLRGPRGRFNQTSFSASLGYGGGFSGYGGNGFQGYSNGFNGFSSSFGAPTEFEEPFGVVETPVFQVIRIRTRLRFGSPRFLPGGFR